MTVGASDVNDTSIISLDTSQMESSAGNEIEVDNLKTNEENNMLIKAKNNESLSGKIDSEILSVDMSIYSGLSDEIHSGGNIGLQHDYYTYDSGGTIYITVDNSVIDGKGAVIDMAESTNMRVFFVRASNVTIKNLTIKNSNLNDDGRTICFMGSGTVTNCNFTNNTAMNGGAVCFFDIGSVTNCNFTDNEASSFGGAACFYYDGTVTNCNFANNNTRDGGAIKIYGTGIVTNCNIVEMRPFRKM